MKTFNYPIALLGLLVLFGCKKDRTPAPAPPPPITLTQGGGYWEWESHSTMPRYLTPANTGIQRRLRFGSDSTVYIYHNQQLMYHTPYQLSRGQLPRCGSKKVYLLVRYVTNLTKEPQFWNNDLREYSITQTGSNAQLIIRGESECTDGGAAERYRWHPE